MGKDNLNRQDIQFEALGATDSKQRCNVAWEQE